MLPAPYVKVYLVSGKKCVDKMKTSTARRTLDPLYQQQLVFKQSYSGCVLQVSKRTAEDSLRVSKSIRYIHIKYYYFQFR